MTQEIETKRDSKLVEIVTFYLGGSLYGVDILKVQEINKLRDWTPVPQSEDFVLGIVSLRGNIVTIIDLSRKLGLKPTNVTESSRSIVVNSDGQPAGFVVDSINNVTQVDWDQVCDPPANVNGVQGSYLEGVLKTEDNLIAILKISDVVHEVELKQPA